MKITITIDLPPSALSPNGSPNKWARIRAARLYRAAAGWAAIEALKGKRPQLQAARITIRAYYKVDRTRDDDNLITSLKAARDGFTDAGLWINDKGAKVAGVDFFIDKKRPRIEIDIESDEN